MSSALNIFGFLLFLLKGKVESVTFDQPSSQVVKEGTEGFRINCSHDGSSLQTMLWYQHKQSNQSMSLIGYTVIMSDPVYEGQFRNRFQLKREGMMKGSLIFLTVDSSDSAVYFCAASPSDSYSSGLEAYFGGGTKLTVLDPNRKITPPTVKVFQPSSKECRNLKDEKERKKTLLCVARDFYPDHVSIFWQVNAKNVTKGVATDPAARLDDKTYFITSRLRVHAEVWTSPGTNFSCFVTFFDGNKTIIKDETVFAVEVDGSVKTRVKYLRSTQSFKLSYTVFIIKSSIYGAFVAFLVWKLQGSTGKQKY